MERADLEQWKRADVARIIALLESERRYYQEMAATLPVGLAVFSRERSVVSANRAFRRIFGIPAGELSGRTLEQILPDNRVLERVRDLHVHGVAPPAFVVEHGATRLRISLAPIRPWNEDGENETLLTVVELDGEAAGSSAGGSRSGARGVEAAGVAGPESAAGFPRAGTAAGPIAVPAGAFPLDSLPAIVWQARADTLAFTAVSGAAMAMLGYPAPQWLRSRDFFESRIHADDREAVMELYRAAIEQGENAHAEFRAVSASGEAVWCRESISAAGGSVFGVMTGVGARRDLERQRITTARIEALQAISARLSHDLNNPLMIITGYAEDLLAGVPQNDPRRADLQQILDATERMAALTDQLLQFTRKQAKPPRPMDLAASIQAVEKRIRKAAGDSVAVEIAAEEQVWIHADRAQMEEILVALASGGAEQAQGRTRIEIRCEIARIDEFIAEGALPAGFYAQVVIHSDGQGASAEQQARMFESFLIKDQADTGLARISRAYSVVREWGGDIAFTGDPPRGSSFTLLLPLAERPEEAGASRKTAVKPEGPAEETLPQTVRETILVVDDEPGIRQLVAKILRRERHVVLEAGSAREAIAAASQHRGPIDLLLTDVMLPDRSGREVAEQLRQALPGLKVLYISGFTDDESVRGGEYPAGAKFLQKPFTLGALMGKVRESLDQ